MRIAWFLIVLCSIASTAQTDCDLKLDKDSIKVFSCKVANSKFRSVKSTFVITSTPSKLAAVAMDIDRYGEWQYKTVSAKVLKRVSERELIYHTEIAAPMLTSNRDFVLRLTVDQIPNTNELIIDAVSIPDYIPRVKNVIRVPFSKARWKVKQLTSSTLSVEYTIEIDIGGAVPPWIVNLLAHQAPYETFKALRTVAKGYTGRASFVRD